MANEKKKPNLQVEDRVRRLDGSSCPGTIKTLREEVVGSAGEAGQTDYLVQVQWDNGTLSYIAPESLTVIKD